MNTVELQAITKTFGDIRAVDAVSLAVPTGSIYGFIGPNGSGKTTTLRMIMNIIYPDRGQILIFGQPLLGPRSDRIGYLPEERGLYKNMKVRDLLRFYGQLKAGHQVNREVETWLEKLDLASFATQKVETLSKGTSQRVQFAATVVAKPDLLILDEPFSGLDPVNVEVIRSAVLDLRQEGATIILSTHDMAVAENMCDFIFMIDHGRKVLDGTLSSIQDQYGDDTIRLRIEGGPAILQDIPGVEGIRNFGQLQEMRMSRGCQPQEVLRAVLARTTVQQFEVTRPSLHDIFVRVARPTQPTNDHA